MTLFISAHRASFPFPDFAEKSRGREVHHSEICRPIVFSRFRACCREILSALVATGIAGMP